MWLFALLILGARLGDVVEVEVSVTSVSDRTIQAEAERKAMEEALAILTNQTGTILSDTERDALIKDASRYIVRASISRMGYDAVLSTNVLRGTYWIDVGRVVRDLTARRAGSSPKRLELFLKNVPEPMERDILRLFPSMAWRISVHRNPRRYPRRCRSVCLRITYDEGKNELTYEIRQGRRKWHPIATAVPHGPDRLVLSLPDGVTKALGAPQTERVSYTIRGFDSPFDMLRFVGILAKQKGTVLSVYSWTIDGDALVVEAEVFPQVASHAMDGLFLGEGITLAPSGTVDGRNVYTIVLPVEEEGDGQEDGG